MANTKKEETERIIRMLRTAMRLLGLTNREIERRLSYTPSYLTRLFSGQIELRFEHIHDITRAMGMTVDEFFRFSYPERGEKPSEAAVKLDAMLEEMRPTPPPPESPRAWREEEFERTVVSALEKVVAREQEEVRRKLLEDAGQIKELLEKWDRMEKEWRAMIRAQEREERAERREEAGRSRSAARKGAKKA
jgi:transcriptional regulator with XRE-family HTH domain